MERDNVGKKEDKKGKDEERVDGRSRIGEKLAPEEKRRRGRLG